jgi:hypothetical protein
VRSLSRIGIIDSKEPSLAAGLSRRVGGAE